MENKTCKRCSACKRLYARSLLRFWRHGELYCEAKDEITKADDTCAQWQRDGNKKYDLSEQRFEKSEEDIKYMIALFDGG